MKYFSFNELCRSNAADDMGINQVPDNKQSINLTNLVRYILDPLREFIQHPIYINSGFRCKEVNAAVGGVSTSQHLSGCAADISFKEDFEYTYLVYLILQCDLMPYKKYVDQCILYKSDNFIHVSISESGSSRMQFFKK